MCQTWVSQGSFLKVLFQYPYAPHVGAYFLCVPLLRIRTIILESPNWPMLLSLSRMLCKTLWKSRWVILTSDWVGPNPVFSLKIHNSVRYLTCSVIVNIKKNENLIYIRIGSTVKSCTVTSSGFLHKTWNFSEKSPHIQYIFCPKKMHIFRD